MTRRYETPLRPFLHTMGYAMKSKKTLSIALACVTCLFPGCMTGPDYQRPEAATPDSWSSPLEGGETGQSPQLAQWWKYFGDATLDVLVTDALNANYDLKIAEANIREARANLYGAKAGLWPQLNTSGSYQRMQNKGVDTSDTTNSSLSVSANGVSVTRASTTDGSSLTISRDPTGHYDVTRNFGAGLPGVSVGGDQANGLGLNSLSVPLETAGQGGGRQANLYQAGFDASWELDLFGGTRRAIEAAKADAEAVDENRQAVCVTLTAEVAENYFGLRSAQSLLEILNNNIRIQNETLDIARARFDAGLTNELDVRTAEAQLATIKANEPLLEESIQYAIHRLSVLTGREPGALKEQLAPAQALPETPPEVPVGLPSDLLRRRPDVRRAERQLAAATARIGVATAELFPKFSLTGSFGGSGSTLDALGKGINQTWSLGPGIRWPIFDAGRIRANIQVQNARQEQALLAYESAVLNSMEDAENALVSYAKEQEHLKLLATALEAEQKALDIAKDRYSQGLVDFLSVLDAQRSLYSVDEQHTQSEATVLTRLVSLYKALGGGWEAPQAEAPAP